MKSFITSMFEDKNLCDSFYLYCQHEHNEENIEFILDVNKFRMINDRDKLVDNFLRIYNKYFMDNILNIRIRTINELKKIVFVDDITKNSFDDAYKETLNNMLDIICRYRSSCEYSKVTKVTKMKSLYDYKKHINNKINTFINNHLSISFSQSYLEDHDFVVINGNNDMRDVTNVVSDEEK